MRAFVCGAVASLSLAVPLQAEERDKLADDPTKVVTKLGASYSDEFAVSGSLAFGPVSKVNARVSETGEWSLGGSYLFKYGIVNVSASRSELSSGVEQTRFSLGSFAPILRDTENPTAWQVFGMFGFNYTEGDAGEIEFSPIGPASMSMTSKGGYIGAMGLKPLSQKWTFRGVAVLSQGSNDYSGIAVGGGFSFYATKLDTFSIMAFYSDNSFGKTENVGIGYQREF